jgi:hypothetical protein
LQNPSQINRDNLQSLRHETSTTFRNKKREYLKGKINELETNNKIKNIGDQRDGCIMMNFITCILHQILFG